MPITLVQGDITEQQVDVIVNAANSSLLGGGGVDGAIHRRGGPAILADCRRLRASHYGKGLPTGQAVATTAGDLPARWVVHTVGPVHSAKQDRTALLASCFRESLRVADELGAASVAFPAVSTGIYGWPMDDAAEVAVATVRSTSTQVRDVRFVLFDARAHTAFEHALQSAGPSNDEIVATLVDQPDERWHRLFTLVDELTEDDLNGGGHETRPGVTHVPFPRYSDRINAILGLLSELRVVVPFNWSAWQRTVPSDIGVADAPVTDAARMATALIRGERFCDGTIAAALREGRLQEILARLRHWYDTERRGAGQHGRTGPV
jgi:O-acetyl-ADP-ribose deacetylase (regulator of RNase III)